MNLRFRQLYSKAEKAKAEFIAEAELQRQSKKQRRCGYEARWLEAYYKKSLFFPTCL
jgi:hypothetical protein